MKKGSIIIAVLVVLILAVFISLYSADWIEKITGKVIVGENIVPNGEFNQGVLGNPPTYWKKASSVLADISKEEKLSIPYSLKVVYDYEKGNITGYVQSSEFDLEANTTYKASYAAKSLSGDKLSTMYIECDENKSHYAEQEYTANSEWKIVRFEFKTNTWTDFKDCIVMLKMKNATRRDTLFFDDVKIQKAE